MKANLGIYIGISPLRSTWTSLVCVAERKGLEPSASGVTGRRYNRLNYRSVVPVVGSTGLEPVTPAV